MRNITLYLETLSQIDHIEFEDPSAWAAIITLLEDGINPVVTFDRDGNVTKVSA